MEEMWLYFLCALPFVFLFSFLRKSAHNNFPPRPPSLPLIGHLHLMKAPVHRKLQNLSNQYGPILSLSFGNRNVVVVSSPSMVEECLNKNDLVFANRPRLLAGQLLNYNYSTIATCSYGQLWRNLRRLAALEVFSAKRLNMFLSIRQEEVKFLIKDLYQVSSLGMTKVEMRSRLFALTFNIIMRIIAGKRYFGGDVEDGEEAKCFRDLISDVFELSAATIPGDFVPFLQLIDFQGVKKRMLKLQKKSDDFIQGLIDEHRRKKEEASLCPQSAEVKNRTMIDIMLSLQESEPENYPDEIIKGLVWALLVAGTDTSAATMEWGMSLLLNNPEVLKTARLELDKRIGPERLVDEPDCTNLPYLQGILNETLRLYPAAPLLAPHESSESCYIGGYYIPRGTMLLVNAWAIQRDPKMWEDPTSFRPERFEGMDSVDSYRLMPFGLGRRACPGAGLAKRVVASTLAALIHCFEWERLGEEEVDMSEATGLSMPKAQPLEAMYKPRESMIGVLDQL